VDLRTFRSSSRRSNLALRKTEKRTVFCGSGYCTPARSAGHATALSRCGGSCRRCIQQDLGRPKKMQKHSICLPRRNCRAIFRTPSLRRISTTLPRPCKPPTRWDLHPWKPLFSRITFHLDERWYKGAKFTITVENQVPYHPHVQSTRLTGKPLTRAWIGRRTYRDEGAQSAFQTWNPSNLPAKQVGLCRDVHADIPRPRCK
jgi:hypothetical protein